MLKDYFNGEFDLKDFLPTKEQLETIQKKIDNNEELDSFEYIIIEKCVWLDRIIKLGKKKGN